jgi:hypothetical protein
LIYTKKSFSFICKEIILNGGSMATLNLRNPNGYDGQPGTQNKQGIVRFATAAEAAAGTLDNVAISPATAQSATALDFASPPVAGFGSTTPRPVAATTLAATGTVGINISGAGVTTIGTGGTGATNIGNATGNTAVTGSLTASTSLTATLGNITATNGNFVKGTAGNKDVYTSLATTTAAGANSAGTVTLVGGTATISTTSVTASSKIRLYRQSVGATGAAATGNLSVGTISAGTSFIINSVLIATATSLATTDVSVVFWEIVN